MSDDLYSNLLRATDNTADITTEKQGTITKIQDKLCNVKEEATGLEHTNVPVINEVQVKEGDTVLLGFLDNNIYNPVVYGVIGKTVHDDTKQDLLVSGTNIKTINHLSLLGAGNITIQGGGGGDTSVIGTGSFTINENGHLIVELPNAVDNPYYINQSGHLIYDTTNTHNEGAI